MRKDLAKEALSRRKTYQETATALNGQLNAQSGQVETLKKNLLALEGKIAEARTKKDMLKARAQAAQAQAQLQGAVGGLSTDSSMAAFERMEEKVQALEAQGQALLRLPVLISIAASRLWKPAMTWMPTLRPSRPA